MANLDHKFMAVLVMATFVLSGAQGQLRAHVPERLEFFEGHAYIGSDSSNGSTTDWFS